MHMLCMDRVPNTRMVSRLCVEPQYSLPSPHSFFSVADIPMFSIYLRTLLISSRSADDSVQDLFKKIEALKWELPYHLYPLSHCSKNYLF